MNSIRQLFFNDSSASRAQLACVARINEYNGSTSVSCFVNRKLHELIPRYVSYALSDSFKSVFSHLFDIKLFKGDDLIFIYQMPREFMYKVFSLVRNLFMEMGYFLALFFSILAFFFALAQSALKFCEPCFIGLKEAGIFDFLSRRQRCKGFETNVNTDYFLNFTKRLWFYFTGKTSIPFACRTSLNSAGFNLPVQLPMKFNLDRSYFGKFGAIPSNLKTTLGECEGAISSLSFESWIALTFPTTFRSAEEGFKGKINPYCHILQNLRMHSSQRRSFLLEFYNRNCLSMIIERFSFILPRMFTLFEKMIVNPTTFFKYIIQQSNLFFSREKAIFKIRGYRVDSSL